jgi:hypothetical protein
MGVSCRLAPWVRVAESQLSNRTISRSFGVDMPRMDGFSVSNDGIGGGQQAEVLRFSWVISGNLASSSHAFSHCRS